MDPHSLGACPPFMFEGEATSSEQMQFQTSPPGAYFEAQNQYSSHDHVSYEDQSVYSGLTFPSHPLGDSVQGYIDLVKALPFGFSANYPAVGLQDQSLRSHQRHQSTSAHSNHSSTHRSSDVSVFSLWPPRSSVASTSTTWSQFSDFTQEQYIAQTQRILEAQSPLASPPPVDEQALIPARRAHECQHSQEKEPFLTCVERTKRSRRPGKEPRYWCTACGEGFREKYDWKRHEETYQERTEMFECELCLNVYFLDKDFIHHHKGSHRCQVCVPKCHVEHARRPRQARTGWGCGFCVHFSNDWSERCNHISDHFEKKGQTMENWKHSRVIFSLLQRSEILQEWCHLLESKQRTQNPFSWRPETTGRSGYPDNGTQPQLQDLLEFYKRSQGSAAAIARLAFETGLREKEPPSAPPPVPEKDYYPLHRTRQSRFPQSQQTATYSTTAGNNSMTDMPTWNRFLGTIPEDSLQLTNVVTLDYDVLSAAFGNSYDHTGRF